MAHENETVEQMEQASATEMTDSGARVDDADAPIDMAAQSPKRPVQAVGPGDIRAEEVNLSQGGANLIEAKKVSITQGGAANVRAEEISISQGGVALARTRNLTIAENASSLLVVADKATVEDGASVFLLVAGSAAGDVRPALDWRSALALGAGFALVMSLIRRVLR